MWQGSGASCNGNACPAGKLLCVAVLIAVDAVASFVYHCTDEQQSHPSLLDGFCMALPRAVLQVVIRGGVACTSGAFGKHGHALDAVCIVSG
jgi:hypothetical protein